MGHEWQASYRLLHCAYLTCPRTYSELTFAESYVPMLEKNFDYHPKAPFKSRSGHILSIRPTLLLSTRQSASG